MIVNLMIKNIIMIIMIIIIVMIIAIRTLQKGDVNRKHAKVSDFTKSEKGNILVVVSQIGSLFFSEFKLPTRDQLPISSYFS